MTIGTDTKTVLTALFTGVAVIAMLTGISPAFLVIMVMVGVSAFVYFKYL